MPEFTITLQNKEGLHGHSARCFIDTVRKYNGAIRGIHKTRKIEARSILQMLTPGFFVGSTEPIHADSIAAGTSTRPWQTLNESRFGEAE
jgi:phosphotransferase system HPr-like phosphotransfer protein